MERLLPVICCTQPLLFELQRTAQEICLSNITIFCFQRTMPQDLYGRTKGPGMGPRPGMEEMDFSDDDATPLTEPIYSGRFVITYCTDVGYATLLISLSRHLLLDST